MARRPLNIQTPGAVAAAEPAVVAEDVAPVLASVEPAEPVPPQESVTLAAERARIAKQAYLTPEGWVCPS